MEIIAAIDPVTRIEGHLRVNVTIDSDGSKHRVTDAKASGTLFRGFEKILVGRDPRDAQHITERICGICPVAHGMAAVQAIDAAWQARIPTNGRLLRNLVTSANMLDSHILHFYLLVMPDFFDGPGKGPWMPTWPVDKRFDEKEAADLLEHYRQAIKVRRLAHEVGALFGGRMPHPPAFIPGGFTAVPRPERIKSAREKLESILAFTRDTYIPDVDLLADRYPDYSSIGKGHGHLMAFGALPLDDNYKKKLFQPGRRIASQDQALPLEPNSITEAVKYSWYTEDSGGLHPATGKTEPDKKKDDAYSWLKSPRHAGLPMETGPLARLVVNGQYPFQVSVLDRLKARALETRLLAEASLEWLDALSPRGRVYREPDMPEEAEGEGLTEAPRGALGHWLRIEKGRIAHYQVITPTTWNAGPRDEKGVPGPLEMALIGTEIQDPNQPIEVLRVIHSMDPCLDCAVHVMRPSGGRHNTFPILQRSPSP
jgi:hydrogenase large subunit